MTKRSKKVKHAPTVDGSMICIAESEECVREINELWLNNTRTRIMEFMGTKPMTKFEEEIKAAIKAGMRKEGDEFCLYECEIEEVSPELLKIAKRYIEKAFNDAKQMEPYLSTAERYPDLNQWLKENGITS